MNSNNISNVLLIGIGGVYNYGCEAIVRGTVSILKNQFPKIKISYASYNYEYDKVRLADCDINIIDRTIARKITLKRIIRKLLSYLNIRISIPYDNIRFVKKNKFDTILSIGGDIYTLDSKNNYNKSLPEFCEKCQKAGLKYILFGASIGPFDKNKKAELFFKNHLKNIDLIIAREEYSIIYLNSLGIKNNVVFAPDPAFFVAPELIKNDRYIEKNKIGINLSPLSSLYFYPDLNTAQKKLSNIISHLIDLTDSDVIMIPHVYSKFQNDDDLRFLKGIFNLIPNKNKNRISVIENDEGFVNAKKEIIKCDLLISSRMHCAINGVSANVPTIFISYSQKAIGMANLIYGKSDYVVPLNFLENPKKMVELINSIKLNSKINNLKLFDFEFVFKSLTYNI